MMMMSIFVYIHYQDSVLAGAKEVKEESKEIRLREYITRLGLEVGSWKS
jgi:hypothetical protein